MSEEYPLLRAVEAFPIEENGQSLLALRDPLSYCEDIIAVPMAAAPLMQMMNGRNSIRDIQADHMRRTGQLAPIEMIEGLVEQLEEKRLLDGKAFAEYVAELEEEFRASPTRRAFHAGKSYDADPAGLSSTLSEVLSRADGASPDTVPVALIAPHIDIPRGAAGYANAYGRAGNLQSVDTFFILGICHQSMKNIFSLTHKNYETPLGTLRTNSALVDKITAASAVDLLEDEFQHRTEHSIEFQCLFLQHLAGHDRELSIVPVLCGSFQEFWSDGEKPINDRRVSEFVTGLRDALDDCANPCIVAGVDLAHIGPQFGDPEPVSEKGMEDLKEADTEMLKIICDSDPAAFHRSISADCDARKVCGAPAIYTLLETLEGKKGELLHYGQCPDPQGVVSFASVVFSR